MTAPDLHATADAELVVGKNDLASSLSIEEGDSFPPVLATARMVALMEVSCARLLRPHLSAGELSVGVNIEASHSAPTPEGATVTATARYLGREGKLFIFEVIVKDAGGEIGRARHKRAIVNAERLASSAVKRVPPHP